MSFQIVLLNFKVISVHKRVLEFGEINHSYSYSVIICRPTQLFESFIELLYQVLRSRMATAGEEV